MKMKILAKIKRRSLILGILFAMLVIGIVYAATSYQVNSGATSTINEWSVCKKVTNNNALAIFVPTNTAAEWTAFRTNASGVSYAECCSANGVTCSTGGDCCSGNCVNGYCCNTTCIGNCDRCNVAGSLGTCTNVNADCTGNCDVCSGGNCAASNALCSNTTASCGCSGSGTVFNCTSCTTDPYGVCGHPICSAYTCSQAYDNGICCAQCHYCSSGSCSAHYYTGYVGCGCTYEHHYCEDGSCNEQWTVACVKFTNPGNMACTLWCPMQGYGRCFYHSTSASCGTNNGNCDYVFETGYCACKEYTF